MLTNGRTGGRTKKHVFSLLFRLPIQFLKALTKHTAACARQTDHILMWATSFYASSSHILILYRSEKRNQIKILDKFLFSEEEEKNSIAKTARKQSIKILLLSL